MLAHFARNDPRLVEDLLALMSEKSGDASSALPFEIRFATLQALTALAQVC